MSSFNYGNPYGFQYPNYQPGAVPPPGAAPQFGAAPQLGAMPPQYGAAPTAPPMLVPQAVSYLNAAPPATSAAGTNEEYFWIQTSADDCRNLEYLAVFGGHDADGSAMYVGRTQYNNETIPCKVIPRNKVAYFAYQGEEKVARNFELYCRKNPRIQWKPCTGGEVPVNAIPVGSTASGEILYAGRVKQKGCVTVGKVQQSQKCCYISFGGKELPFGAYEVMVFI